MQKAIQRNETRLSCNLGYIIKNNTLHVVIIAIYSEISVVYMNLFCTYSKVNSFNSVIF